MRQTFQVMGMSCGHCVAAVTAELSKIAGVGTVEVDLAAGEVSVDAETELDRGEVAAAVDEAGFELVST